MSILRAKLERWAAWAPGIEMDDEWRAWAENKPAMQLEGEPSVKFLPAMFRRRLTRLSKMALNVAYRCLPDEEPLHTVFCSRHGDFNMTRGLLDELVKGELISPTRFSMSVHNTASGLYTIARKDKSPSTAMASGEDSLESGFLEAASLLHSQRANRVLLVICDEPVPEPFTQSYKELMWPYAVAFLLAPVQDRSEVEGVSQCSGRSMSLSIENKQGLQDQSESEPHALSLLRCLINNEPSLLLPTRRLTWLWKCES